LEERIRLERAPIADQEEGRGPLRELLPRLKVARLVSEDQEDGRDPLNESLPRLMPVKEGTPDQAAGSDPTKPELARLTDVGRPFVHVTPVHNGKHGLLLGSQPDKLAAAQLLAETVDRMAARAE